MAAKTANEAGDAAIFQTTSQQTELSPVSCSEIGAVEQQSANSKSAKSCEDLCKKKRGQS